MSAGNGDVQRYVAGDARDHASSTPARSGASSDLTARQTAESERDAAETNRDRFAFLAEVSRCLADSLDYEVTLTTVAGMSLPYLGAWCVVDLIECAHSGAANGTEQIRRLTIVHPDPLKQMTARELHEHYPPAPDDFIGAPRVMRSGRPEMVFDVPDSALVAAARDAKHLDLLRTLGVKAYVIAPMMARGHIIGAITFVTAETGRRFGDIDLLMAEDIARRAGMAVENARLHREAVAMRGEAEAALASARRLAVELEKANAAAEMRRQETATNASRLQSLTAALSVAATEEGVAHAVVAHASAVFGAAGIVIARISATGEFLEIISAGAMPAEISTEWARFPIGAPVPMADVARSGAPMFIESRADWQALYPAMMPLVDATGHQANAIAPLVVEGRVLGVLGAAFDAPRVFGADARALTLAVAQQCAQALERARLLEAERQARAEAEAARAAAETANRAKAEFLASMSHELRTPLNAIGGYTQLIEMGLHGPVTEPQREALSRIDLAQRHLLRLVNDVLNFARLQAGRLEYDLQSVSLAEVVGSLEALLGPQLQARGVTYGVSVPRDCLVSADRNKLTQVLLNLLSNAMKFTPAGGRITIECAERQDGSQDPTTVFLRVVDTGIGIPREKLNEIFEPFVQVDASSTGRTGGAGLGLSISRDLTRGMGGDIRVRSVQGTGTTFTVALPRG